MKRLAKKNLNTPTSYIQKPLDWFDNKRIKHLLRFYEGGNILDLGSFNSPLKEWYEDYTTSVDWVPDELPYKNESFYYVIMGQLLEHLEDPSKYLKEAMRVLKIGGVLALSVPLNETKSGEVDKEHHLWSFSEQDIVDLISPYGRYEIEILKSQHIPEYKYHFPYLISHVQKN